MSVRYDGTMKKNTNLQVVTTARSWSCDRHFKSLQRRIYSMLSAVGIKKTEGLVGEGNGM